MRKLYIGALTLSMILCLSACAPTKKPVPSPIHTPLASTLPEPTLEAVSPTPEPSAAVQTEVPVEPVQSRMALTEGDKDGAANMARVLLDMETGLGNATVYEISETDGYNCIVTVGYTAANENGTDELNLVDYDMHYENGAWVMTASHIRGNFDRTLYDVHTTDEGKLEIIPIY